MEEWMLSMECDWRNCGRPDFTEQGLLRSGRFRLIGRPPSTLGPEVLQPGFTTIAWQHPIKKGDGFGSAISGVFGKATSYKDWREEVAGALVR